MKNLIQFSTLFFLFLLMACQPNNNTLTSTGESIWDNDRPHDPWVFRSVLDKQARMITIALHDDMWVAYDAEKCAIYKVWKGGVNFDGPVYTTVHGPQPTSIGKAFLISKKAAEKIENPWRVIANGKEVEVEIKYKGHHFEDGEVVLQYEIPTTYGTNIKITERPEYQADKNGMPVLERMFTTSGIPSETQMKIALITEVSSLAVKNNLKTDGTWEELHLAKAEDNPTISIKGKLTLNNNASTFLNSTFVKSPTIADPNRKSNLAEAELAPLGSRLIDRSDCKSCHNERVKTVGPSYVEIAEKYDNTNANIEMLISKVMEGGSGNWGEAAMTPHPDLAKADVKEMISYIMDLDKEQEQAIANSGERKPNTDLETLKGAKVDPDQITNGLLLKFWQLEEGIENLNSIDFNSKPKFESIVPEARIKDSDFLFSEGNFAIEYSGYIYTPEANNVLIRMRSDDGSRLFIDGNEIINHDGHHGMDIRDGEISAEEGVHHFKLQYFQGGGGKGLELSYRTFEMEDFEPIPAEAFLYHKKEQVLNDKIARLPGAIERKPGDRDALLEVHPSFDLAQARPDDFLPKVGGLDFLSDGRMVVSCWDAAGSVYIVEGAATGDPSQMKYKMIAKGLAEPLGLKVVDDVIYVLQKQELTKLIDSDGDEIIDQYETVSNKWRASANFHEFAFGLVYKEGHFYATLATAINPGGASTQPQIPDRGKVVRINRETGQTDFIASGLRTPNGIGIGVDSEIFVADNQGDWLPVSKILHITEGAWFGSRSVDFEGTANLKEKKPVVWLPQNEIGNSPSTPIAINVGPYKGQMIHGEVTHGGVKRVFVEKVNGEYQGALFRFTQGFEAGVNRIAWGPDGALYVGGVGSTGNWGHAGKAHYGLQKINYNNKPTFEMLAVRAKRNGVEIEFTQSLATEAGEQASNYDIEQWYYLPTAAYGGPKLGKQDLSIRSINVSEDRKKVFLELGGMKENHVVYIRLNPETIKSAGDLKLWTTECWYTMNQIPKAMIGMK